VLLQVLCEPEGPLTLHSEAVGKKKIDRRNFFLDQLYFFLKIIMQA
jgi:hypothetical protein